MNQVHPLARRSSRARSIVRSQGPSFSSDNPLPAFLAFLTEDTKVRERTARQYVAHLQHFTAWLEQRYQAPLLKATTRDLRQYKTELGKRQKPASLNAALAAVRRLYGWASDIARSLATLPSA
jgi:site-specific recombinase XerD